MLSSKLKGKKRELDTANGVFNGLNNQLKEAQTEVTTLRTKVEQLEKENADLKAKKKEELDEAEQRGYDLYFEEQIEAVKKIQGRLFQAGCDFGLNKAIILSTSALMVLIFIHWDIKYVDEDKEDDGDVESSEAGDQEGKKRPQLAALWGHKEVAMQMGPPWPMTSRHCRTQTRHSC